MNRTEIHISIINEQVGPKDMAVINQNTLQGAGLRRKMAITGKKFVQSS